MVAQVIHNRIDLHNMTLASKFVDVVNETSLFFQEEWHMRESEISFDVIKVFMIKLSMLSLVCYLIIVIDICCLGKVVLKLG